MHSQRRRSLPKDNEDKDNNKKKEETSTWLYLCELNSTYRLLIKLVDQYGIRKWSHIAQMLTGRIGKQCRERWHNHLRPNIKKEMWTEEEDKILIQAHCELGNKWAEIAKHLPGRTENSIKNHWNATKRRQLSRKRTRNSKYSKSGYLLQNYIKSISITSTTPPSFALKPEHQESAVGNEELHSMAYSSVPPEDPTANATTSVCHMSDACLTPVYNFNKVPDVGGKSINEMYDVAALFDQFGCGLAGSSSKGNKDFEMEMGWDATMPPLMMTPPSENVKREMDLIEMISQNNIINNSLI